MRLTADDLRAIADTVDKIGAAGLDVEVVTVRGHRVLLKSSDSQMEGIQYYVIGVGNGELAGQVGMVMREAEGKAEASSPLEYRRRW